MLLASEQRTIKNDIVLKPKCVTHTYENLITIELCDRSGPICNDEPEEISTEILFTNIYRNTYLQKYVVASPGHGHSGVGPEQAADHLVHHPAGDCR